MSNVFSMLLFCFVTLSGFTMRAVFLFFQTQLLNITETEIHPYLFYFAQTL